MSVGKEEALHCIARYMWRQIVCLRAERIAFHMNAIRKRAKTNAKDNIFLKACKMLWKLTSSTPKDVLDVTHFEVLYLPGSWKSDHGSILIIDRHIISNRLIHRNLCFGEKKFTYYGGGAVTSWSHCSETGGVPKRYTAFSQSGGILLTYSRKKSGVSKCC